MEDIYTAEFNDTGITPCGFKMLIEIPPVKKQHGLIHVPISAQDKEQRARVVAKVLQLGNFCYRDESKYPVELGGWCRPGDFVVMSPYQGTRIELPGSDRTFHLINEDAIDAIIPNPDHVVRG
jgi:co-chaperonin GroES (HSP10)